MEDDPIASEISDSEVIYKVSIPTFVIDRNHRVVHWNKAMENLTGIRASDMVGTRHHWKGFYPIKKSTLADLVVDNMLEEVMSGICLGKFKMSEHDDSSFEAEILLHSVGGKERWLICTVTSLEDAEGNVIGAVESVQDVTERRRMEENLRDNEQKYREMSITDSLTKLYNSRHFFQQMNHEIERSERYQHPLSIMLLDIDDFKKYNDTYGHLEGDNALLAVAEVIRNSLRSTDSAFRFGGEEFTVILPETDVEEALEVAERLKKNISEAWLLPSSKLRSCVTASIGVSKYVPGEPLSILIERTDGAMYSAKKMGKDRVCLELYEHVTKQMPLFSS